ncbi:serine hydrolase [Pollutibacter soli]|uniref:serine hydrolase domain-containing protein n=1 Tax=Pollutibacter soli TaxID=3034157 RepID=UPI003013B024
MLNCLKFSIVLGFMLFFQVSSAQPDSAHIESIIKQNQKLIGNDIAIIVSKGGKNIYTREIPEFKLKNPAPVNSVSRWFTAALVMIYVDEGKISLDDKVGKYLPIFNTYLKGYITIRHCLANTTGIRAEAAGIMKLTEKKRFESLEAEVNNIVSKKDIQDNAGTAYFYSDLGTVIAGRVLEVVGKKSFDQLAQQKLFRPLGMRNSSFYAEKGSVDPAAGANSSAFDMMNFMTMLMNNGMFNGKKVLSEASVEQLLKKQFTDQPVKYIPKELASFIPVPGAWIEEADGSGKPIIISSPGFSGPIPWINFGKGYAAVILPQKELSDEKQKPIIQIRNDIDSRMN